MNQILVARTGIKSILNNYYEAEISELEPAERPLARKFIEEGLIVGGRRVGVSEGVEKQNFGITATNYFQNY